MSVIDALKTREVETAEKAAAAFESLAQRIADGEEVAESEARKILKAADKTPDDLEARVATLRKIGELRVQLASLEEETAAAITEREECWTQVQRAEKAVKKAQDALEAARLAHSLAVSQAHSVGNQREIVRQQLDALMDPPPPAPKPENQPFKMQNQGWCLPPGQQPMTTGSETPPAKSAETGPYNFDRG